MKKAILLAYMMVASVIIAGCGNVQQVQNDTPKAKLRSEKEIIADLNSQEYYLTYIAEEGGYRVTDLTIQFREAEPVNYSDVSELILATITMKSEYAVYTGDFILKYYKDDRTLEVHQDRMGTFSDIRLPDNSIILEHKAEFVPEGAEIVSSSIDPIEGDSYQCFATIQYKIRNDEECCSTQSTWAYLCGFTRGVWQIEPYGKELESISEYDKISGVYYYPLGALETEIINAYVIDDVQYYDRFVYYSSSDVDYSDMIKYGFSEKEMQIPVADGTIAQDLTRGVKQQLSPSPGPVDESAALQFVEQLYREGKVKSIILDPVEYVENLYANQINPGEIIISSQYIEDETGLNVVEVVHYGTWGYDRVLQEKQQFEGATP